ncbi:methyl-accepting chemotaxis protein [Paenibacillus allorhizosphaerae]|uniref:Methyl-accepting chemotaxis protein n=1 Tax=Paenibacillus allorhizosphaerae TaxID=2849866 RepID=A0ABM8VPJ2_9BACL|nr:methyl-accepting chemotaxis protein [Paenibacillus allorhizosphaerae]CAG7653009.1 hypothetical protein PAECIP111802_05374 [Paenibacillus allorhizosphaerae]
MAWYRNLNLSIKLVATVGLVLIAAFGTLIGLSLRQLHSVSLSKGELEAGQVGLAFSQSFKNDLIGVQSMLQTLSGTLLDAKTQKKLSREDVVRILADNLDKQKNILGIYTVWEPNAFDGNDKASMNKASYEDGTGRFVPYIVRSEGKIVMEPNKDYDKEGTGDYYLLPKKSKNLTLLEPYEYAVAGKKTMITSVVQPILDSSGTFLGIVGVDFSLAELQKKALDIDPASGYVSIVSAKGMYIANGNAPDLISKTYMDSSEKKQIWNGIQYGRMTHYSEEPDGSRALRMFSPILLKGSTDIWYEETVVPESNVLRTYKESMFTSIAISIGAFLLIGALIALVIRHMILRHIKSMVDMMQQLSEGNFTQTMPVRSGDEFGRMAQHFNAMIGKQRGMLRLVTDLSMSVGATSEQLTASAEQTSRASETIAQSIQEVAAGAETQNHHVAEASKAMTDMSLGIQRIAESSLAVSESAQDTAKQSEQGNAAIQEAVEQMGIVRSTVRQSENAIRRLEERSTEIGGIVGIITGISTQTNLLALNAAIEAARVGEHGRGFAVVAAEVRKLAEQTTAAAEQIGQLIKEIRTDTAQAMEAMGQGTAEVEKGVERVSASGELFASIMEEIQSVTMQIQEVSAAAEQMSASSQQVTATVEQVAHIAGEASANSQSVAASSEEQLATMEEISSAAASLSSMVQELLDQMSKFKL